MARSHAAGHAHGTAPTVASFAHADEPEVATDWPRCKVDGCRGARLDPAEKCLAHVDAARRTAELVRFGKGRPLDVRGVVIDDGLWEEISRAAGTDVLGRRRFSNANFSGAVFDTYVDLQESVFARDASFQGAQFRGGLSLAGARVNGQARFATAQFSGPVDATRVTFDGPATFLDADFGREVTFDGAAFNGTTWFSRTRFEADALFRSATFGRHTGFEGTTFGCHADLTGSVFEGDADFAAATFANPPTFDGAVFKGKAGVPNAAARRPAKWWGQPLAPWSARVKGAVIDALVPAAIVAVGFFVAFIVAHLEYGPAVVVGIEVVAIAIAAIFNVRQWVGQGRTGQTLGKRTVGLRLISERDRRPVGPWHSVARGLLHVVDTLPLFAGWLWPLRSEKRQTFADVILGTVVVRVDHNWSRTNAAAAPAPATAKAGFG